MMDDVQNRILGDQVVLIKLCCCVCSTPDILVHRVILPSRSIRNKRRPTGEAPRPAPV